jgi:transketolase
MADNKLNVKLLSMAGQGGSTFGVALMNIIRERDDIMVLSADMSTPAGLNKFKTTFPDNFLNVGIAEQNMIGIAAGLASEGYKVICVAQACFITMRCFEQVRQYLGYMNLPIVLIGIGSGLSLQYMGDTHYAIEDIAIMRTIPNMTALAPSDSLEAIKALEASVNCNKSSYIRLFGGTGIPVVYKDDYDFECGKPITLREGDDVTILATGSMVTQSLLAAEILSEQNVSCEVIDVHTLKPFDNNILRNCKRFVVTVEEHRLIGGLGSIVSEALAMQKSDDIELLRLGIDDNFYPIPGSYNYLLEQCGLTAGQIAEKIKENLKNNYGDIRQNN